MGCSADIPLTLGSWTITMPQLPASKSNRSQWPNCSSPLTDCSQTHFTPLYPNALHSIPELNSVKSYSLGADSQRTLPASFLLLRDVFLCCVCMGHYLAMGLRATYCNGFAQSVSRQRLGKHVPTCNNRRCGSVDECYRLLLGNSQLANKLTG
jgi:hypothetical protein